MILGAVVCDPKNRGLSKKTEERHGQETRAVVEQWVATFKEAVPPPPPHSSGGPLPDTGYRSPLIFVVVLGASFS